MLYKIAHLIQHDIPIVWNMIERCNAMAFAAMKSTGLNRLKHCCSDGIRLATVSDADALASFFSRQPEESFKWFRPHAFDAVSLRRLLELRSYIIYVEEENGEINGYAFLRCFCNGKCFLGKMVDCRHQGKGVCTALCRVGMRMATMLGLKMYESINGENIGSLKASEKACEVTVVERLEDGDVLIEDRPKESDQWYVMNEFEI